MKNWEKELNEMLPLLGHRNWIVITDMAYPLQAQQGVKTIYTNESYIHVLSRVYAGIEAQPHIKPLIYQDKELQYLEENFVAGIDSLRSQITALLGDKVEFVPHETLIARLDEMSRIFNVVILKTTLTIPYTSAFFELDCKYWDKERGNILQQKIKSH